VAGRSGNGGGKAEDFQKVERKHDKPVGSYAMKHILLP
jgi:hypothetical protein